MDRAEAQDQKSLWALAYGTIRPKPTDASPNHCLNRLTRERVGEAHSPISENTAIIRKELWPTDGLKILDAKHQDMHDYDDNRPIVVVEHGVRKILVDGNHRVARWLSLGSAIVHEVLIIQVKGK